MDTSDIIGTMKPNYKPIVETFDRLASGYAFRGGMEEVNRMTLAPVVAGWKGRILDIGCGAGTLIEKYIRPDMQEVYTVDFSIGMIHETKMRLQTYAGRNLFIVNSVAQSLPFARDSFDAALSVNTLHNMPDWPDIHQALAEMVRVLRPRGKLLVEFRNSNNPYRRRLSIKYDKPSLPQKAFTYSEIAVALEKLGFIIEEGIPLAGETVHANFIGKTLERLRNMKTMTVQNAPRFAILATKGPGFRSFLIGDQVQV